MYKCEHFEIHELVPKELYELLHEDVLWKLFDVELLQGLDYVKSKFQNGMMLVNNYKWTGKYSESGIRTKQSKHYSHGSMHSVGKAVDFRFTEYSAKEVYNFLKDDKLITKYFTRMENIEDAPTWIHLDRKPVKNDFNTLYIFNA